MFSEKFTVILLSTFLLSGFISAAELLENSYVASGGAGKRTGADAANAFASIADAWKATAPGGTVHVQPGNYRNQSLTVTVETAGQPDKIKKIQGVKGENGYPRFHANWDRSNPAEGRDFIRLRNGVSHLEISGITVEDYRQGVIGEGGNNNLIFRDLSFTSFRDGIYLNGGDGILIENCRMEGFTKRGIRFVNGVTNAVVKNTVADAGGKEFAVEKFQICFGIGGKNVKPDSDILFENCTARNAYDDAGKDYWNADGFCAEANTSRITWRNCRAFSSTDGGWDIKTKEAKLIDCVAFGNKRNFRIWGTAELTNCIGGYAKMPGGSGTAAGLHVCGNGQVKAVKSTFVGNRITVDADRKGIAVLEACILAPVDDRAQITTVESGAKVEGLENCRLLTVDETSKLFPALPEWDGSDTSYDAPDNSAGYQKNL